MSIYSTLVTDYAYEHPLRATLCFLLATQIAVVLFQANRRDSLKYIPMPVSVSSFSEYSRAHRGFYLGR